MSDCRYATSYVIFLMLCSTHPTSSIRIYHIFRFQFNICSRTIIIFQKKNCLLCRTITLHAVCWEEFPVLSLDWRAPPLCTFLFYLLQYFILRFMYRYADCFASIVMHWKQVFVAIHFALSTNSWLSDTFPNRAERRYSKRSTINMKIIF